MARDPKWDPLGGDVLRDSFGTLVKVTHVTKGIIGREIKGQPVTHVDLNFWRGWYRGATVIVKDTDDAR
jgi:hypothetical protein